MQVASLEELQKRAKDAEASYDKLLGAPLQTVSTTVSALHDAARQWEEAAMHVQSCIKAKMALEERFSQEWHNLDDKLLEASYALHNAQSAVKAVAQPRPVRDGANAGASMPSTPKV